MPFSRVFELWNRFLKNRTVDYVGYSTLCANICLVSSKVACLRMREIVIIVICSFFRFLADRVASVVCTECIVAKRPYSQLRAKVTIDRSISTKTNNLDLEAVLRSCQPLRHIRHWMSRKPAHDHTVVRECCKDDSHSQQWEWHNLTLSWR